MEEVTEKTHTTNEQVIEKQKEELKNVEIAIDLAGKIYKVVTDERFVKLDGEVKLRFMAKKYDNFYRAYPSVINYMVLKGWYSENAFRKFFQKMLKDPGKGMEGYIERQADYVVFLYKDICRKQGKH